MGIKNIKTILTQYSKNYMISKNLNSYKNKVIVIDTSIYLYKYIYNNQNYLISFTKQILRLLKNGIKPIYVFDGKPPIEKKNILKDRMKRKENLIEKKEIITNIIINKKNKVNLKEEILEEEILEENNLEENNLEEEQIIKLEKELKDISKRIITITDIHIQKCKKLFELFNIHYIDSTGEAEVLCAKLLKQNLAHGCLSEDTDVLANGAEIFIRNFNFNKNIINEYSLTNILNDLEISYEQFVDLCILCGCDYTNKIKGMGPINSFKLIKKYKNIEEIIKNIDNKKYKIPDVFNYQRARELFYDNKIDNYIINNINIYTDKKIIYSKENINNIIDYINNNNTNISNNILTNIKNILNNYNN